MKKRSNAGYREIWRDRDQRAAQDLAKDFRSRGYAVRVTSGRDVKGRFWRVLAKERKNPSGRDYDAYAIYGRLADGVYAQTGKRTWGPWEYVGSASTKAEAMQVAKQWRLWAEPGWAQTKIARQNPARRKSGMNVTAIATRTIRKGEKFLLGL